jgi:hypothetical protein
VIVQTAPSFNSPTGLARVRQELKYPQNRSKDKLRATHEITFE